MDTPKYYRIEELLSLVNEPNGSACRRLLLENQALFQTVQGSTHNHQAWPGGYQDHVQEIMNIARQQYFMLKRLRPLPFSLSSTLLVVFLHDIEKPWKYELGEDGHLRHRPQFAAKADDHAFRMEKLAQAGITLTPEELTALTYVEGEFSNYSNRERRMNELGAVCHSADVLSARLWHAHPLPTGDPWEGAERVRDTN